MSSEADIYSAAPTTASSVMAEATVPDATLSNTPVERPRTMTAATLLTMAQAVAQTMAQTIEQTKAQTAASRLISIGSGSAGHLQALKDEGRLVWSQICQNEGFSEKYGHDFSNPGTVHCYMFTRQPRTDTFAFEAFAAVHVASNLKQELVYHPMFEKLIEQYTRSSAKPNPVLRETRSADFCYRLTILVEAMPQDRRSQRPDLRLLREYEVLRHVWERFQVELSGNLVPPDILVGVPMPFEFANVVGYSEYDFSDMHGLYHMGLRGEEVLLSKYVLPDSPGGIGSSLSYMSVEKLGPTVHYLKELLRSQRKTMSFSTALKILDQLLCRLMVLHKYGVVFGNLDTRHINFGVREASKVLYISRYDSALVAPTKERYSGPFSERCASVASLLHREVHFVHDIESAFYVFMSLIFPVLPWDASNKLSAAQAQNNTSNSSRRLSVRSTRAHLDEKANFWSNNGRLSRLMGHMDFEFQDQVYQGFTVDVLTSIYGRAQEAITQCASIPHAEYMSYLLNPNSPANSAYSGIRRAIAVYFQFESLSSISRDPIIQWKVDLLMVEAQVDHRVLWDLNDWCWNVYYPTYVSRTEHGPCP